MKRGVFSKERRNREGEEDEGERMEKSGTKNGHGILGVISDLWHEVDGPELHPAVPSLDGRNDHSLSAAVPKEL